MLTADISIQAMKLVKKQNYFYSCI